MGAHGMPPPDVEIPQVQLAAVHDMMIAALRDYPVIHGELRIIRDNVRLRGDQKEQQAFDKAIWDVKLIIARAEAKIAEQIKDPKMQGVKWSESEIRKAAAAEVVAKVDREIIDNDAFQKFRSVVATSPDPLEK